MFKMDQTAVDDTDMGEPRNPLAGCDCDSVNCPMHSAIDDILDEDRLDMACCEDGSCRCRTH